MSIAQLRAFHFVASYGGFSHAAREMAVSQSTLSGQVRTLEATCGISLFERRARGVRLSEQGEVLFEITSRLFQAEVEAKTFLRRRPEADHAGHIRVAADGPILALPILVGMQRLRPRLTFSLSIDNSDRVTDQILGYHVDVGITARPPRDSRLHGVYLLSMPVGLCVSRGHALADRPFVMLKDLAGHSFVMRERGSRTRTTFEENLAAAGVKIGTVLEISSREGVREAVANGFGCGIVADREFGADSRLVFVPIIDARTMIDEYAICLAERRHLPLIGAFLQEARGYGLAAGATDTAGTPPASRAAPETTG